MTKKNLTQMYNIIIENIIGAVRTYFMYVYSIICSIMVFEEWRLGFVNNN